MSDKIGDSTDNGTARPDFEQVGRLDPIQPWRGTLWTGAFLPQPFHDHAGHIQVVRLHEGDQAV